jgi:hypothetical protein
MPFKKISERGRCIVFCRYERELRMLIVREICLNNSYASCSLFQIYKIVKIEFFCVVGLVSTEPDENEKNGIRKRESGAYYHEKRKRLYNADWFQRFLQGYALSVDQQKSLLPLGNRDC